jgi:hypothetical protein
VVNFFSILPYGSERRSRTVVIHVNSHDSSRVARRQALGSRKREWALADDRIVESIRPERAIYRSMFTKLN